MQIKSKQYRELIKMLYSEHRTPFLRTMDMGAEHLNGMDSFKRNAEKVFEHMCEVYSEIYTNKSAQLQKADWTMADANKHSRELEYQEIKNLMVEILNCGITIPQTEDFVLLFQSTGNVYNSVEGRFIWCENTNKYISLNNMDFIPEHIAIMVSYNELGETEFNL